MPEAEPTTPSPVAPSQKATPERAGQVEQAEAYLRSLGCRECRVRPLDGGLARIEVAPAELARVADPGVREGLVRRLKELGFRFVALDLEGFRSGSTNALVRLGKRPEAILRKR